jgi:hypothetical protein
MPVEKTESHARAAGFVLADTLIQGTLRTSAKWIQGTLRVSAKWIQGTLRVSAKWIQGTLRTSAKWRAVGLCCRE